MQCFVKKKKVGANIISHNIKQSEQLVAVSGKMGRRKGFFCNGSKLCTISESSENWLLTVGDGFQKNKK